MSDFASNPTYVGPLPAPSAAYAGQPTKVAMTALQRANGFIPEQPVAAEHLNAELAALTGNVTALQALNLQFSPGLALMLRDTGFNAALQVRALTTYNLAERTNNVVYVGGTNCPRYPIVTTGTLEAFGVLASQTFKGVAKANTGFGRIAGVTNSPSPLHYSDDQGQTWTSVASANAFGGNNNAEDIGHGTIWGALVAAVTNGMYSSADASAGSWAYRPLNGTAGDIPKRIVGSPLSGRALILGQNAAGTAPFMVESTIGTTWAQIAPPAAADVAGGDIAWDPVRRRFWWLARKSSGFNLYWSPDTGAAVWTLAYTTNVGLVFDSLAVDPVTGLIYIGGSAAFRLMVSFDGGATFFTQTTSVTSVACCAGFLIALDATNDKLYMGVPFCSNNDP